MGGCQHAKLPPLESTICLCLIEDEVEKRLSEKKNALEKKVRKVAVYKTSSSMVASPPAGATAGAAAPLATGTGAALGSKYSLISASSSSTVLGLGRPTRPPLRPPRAAFLVAPPAAAAGLGPAAADLGLLASFLGCLSGSLKHDSYPVIHELTRCGHRETWAQQG